MAGDIRMKEPRTQRTEQVNTAQQDHSANYLFLIIGTPLVAFLIAASAMLESRGFPVPLVRIGTGAAGLILQAIPFMLLGAMMSAAVSTFVSADFLARHIPKSLAGGLAAALVAGLCLPVCDCMVVPTFANLMRKRLPLPCAVTFLCAVPVMNPMAIWSTWFAFTDKPWMVAARMGLGMVVAIVAGVSFAVWPLRSPAVRERPLMIGRSLVCEDCAGATGDSPESHPQSALPTAPAGGSDIPADQRDIPASGGDMSDPAPDPDSIVLFGDSAGGNLAAAVSLMARDRGEFMPRTQMLLYPVVGNDYNPETSPFESVRTNGTDYILTAQDMADYIDMYRSSVADLTNPYFAPLTAHDLSNQPRTLVLSAEYCPLRDEDEAYARRLQLVNDNVSCYRIHDGIHGYLLNTSAVGLVSTTYRIIEHFLDDTPLVPAPGTGTTANAPEGGDAWQDVLGTD